jgi:hypothetical protein
MEIADDRELDDRERKLLSWLLENGSSESQRFLSQIPNLRVASRCPCGCPSINFLSDATRGMKILSDFMYESEDGNPIGVFAFAIGDRLAGIEVWSIAGDAIPEIVPDPDELRPLR